jgi:hypothetical protein
MYKLNHENDKAIDAFNKYLELTGGSDPTAAKTAEDEIKGMGGTPTKKDNKEKPKGKGKGKGKGSK